MSAAPTVAELPPSGRDDGGGSGGGSGSSERNNNNRRNNNNQPGQRPAVPNFVDPWGPPPPPPPFPPFMDADNINNIINIENVGGIGGINNNNNSNNNNWNEAREMWRERERRQRNVRFFMMFMLMLLLMDGEEQQNIQRRQRKEEELRQRKRRHQLESEKLPAELYEARRRQDSMILDRVWDHPRFRRLVDKNGGVDVDRQVRGWSLDQQQQQQQQQDLAKAPMTTDTNADADADIDDGGGSATGNSDGGVEEKADGRLRQEQNHHTSSMDLSSSTEASKTVDPDQEKKVWHYPWNATGFYRGDWSLAEDNDQSMTVTSTDEKKGGTEQHPKDEEQSQSSASKDGTNPDSTTSSSSVIEAAGIRPKKSRIQKILFPDDLKQTMSDRLMHQVDPTMGVYLLPEGIELQLPNITRYTVAEDERTAVSTSRRVRQNNNQQQATFLRGSGSSIQSTSSSSSGYDDDLHDDDDEQQKSISLTRTSGRSAFQLYARPVPTMKELSLIDGFVKLYDSSTVGYSTRRDVLLRVRGVLIHSLGKMSLVANTASAGRAALVFGDVNGHHVNDNGKAGANVPSSNIWNHRRLEEEVAKTIADSKSNTDHDVPAEKIEEIRNAAVSLFHAATDAGEDPTPYASVFSTLDKHHLDRPDNNEKEQSIQQPLTTTSADSYPGLANESISNHDETNLRKPSDKKASIIHSDMGSNSTNCSQYVIPYPFAWDDEQQSLRKNRMPRTARPIPLRERILEANAGSCEFEINLNITEEEWTVGQWRNLMNKQVGQTNRLDPSRPPEPIDEDLDKISSDSSSRKKRRRTQSSGAKSAAAQKQKATLEQVLAMTINGTIVSRDCGFAANVNATAIRTDWEHTTGKAINYSFCMMLTCLTQIVLLLRQLLHTQAQSAAVRVSLLCIGWQTVVDALLCLVHIYLSLAIQPLFSAFASVAFFKLLIFCVIEMKYMAIIIQARNSQNGGNTIELLRRQIAMLHLRFYVALLTCCLGFFYSGEAYRTPYMLLLYSFWVPQIIQNIITETKRPLHPYYVNGMSISRLVAPIYMFGVQSNFLKEVYPESPTSVVMCELLILWVGIQAGIIEAQGRYGARFMIPARFLPPKYDYHRPLPPSLMNPTGDNPTKELEDERKSPTQEVEVRPVINKRGGSPKGGGARNRIKGSKANRPESGMTAETVTVVPKPSCPSLDCVICYNEIDVSDPSNYMLAPCDHIFHKDCLVQWMSVKMECPICRKDLPVL